MGWPSGLQPEAAGEQSGQQPRRWQAALPFPRSRPLPPAGAPQGQVLRAGTPRLSPARPSHETCRPRVPGGPKPPQTAGGDLASLAVFPRAAATAICRGRGNGCLTAGRWKAECGLLAPPRPGQKPEAALSSGGTWYRSARARCLKIGESRAVVFRLFSRRNTVSSVCFSGQ